MGGAAASLASVAVRASNDFFLAGGGAAVSESSDRTGTAQQQNACWK